jgi:hypothetical protein
MSAEFLRKHDRLRARQPSASAAIPAPIFAPTRHQFPSAPILGSGNSANSLTPLIRARLTPLKPEPRRKLKRPHLHARSHLPNCRRVHVVPTPEYCTVLKTLLIVARISMLRVSPICIVFDSDILF